MSIRRKRCANELMCTRPDFFELVPEYFKTQEMCEKAVNVHPWALKFVPDKYKTQGMCNDAAACNPWSLEFVPDYLKTQKMCERSVEEKPYTPHLFWILLIQKRYVKKPSEKTHAP